MWLRIAVGSVGVPGKSVELILGMSRSCQLTLELYSELANVVS